MRIQLWFVKSLFISFLIFLTKSQLISETLTHTMSSDFSLGHFSEDGIMTKDDSLKLAYSAADIAPELHISMGVELKNHASIILNRRIYVSGGTDGTGSVKSAVYSATIESNGSLGNWIQENFLPKPRAYHTMSIWNGTLYVVGGINASGDAQSTVYSASISSNGIVGEWKIEPSISDVRWRHATVIASDRIYVSGGHDSSTIPQNTIYSAQINFDGSLRNWRIENSLPNRLYYHSMCKFYNRLYIIAGKDGNTAQNAVYSASISSDGLLDGWKTETSLPLAVYAHDTVILNNGIYVMGGIDSTNRVISDIFYANISPNGSINRWNQNSYDLQKPRAHHKVTISNDLIYITGGIDENGITQNETIAIGTNYDFHYGQWQTSVNNLPIGTKHPAYAVWNGKLYFIGGYANVGKSKNVYRASINQDGTVGVWVVEQNSLPEPRYEAKAVIWWNRIYVIGGNDGNTNIRGTVYSAVINTDGSIGSWRIENELPTSIFERPSRLGGGQETAAGRSEFAVSVWKGRIYISGGENSVGLEGEKVISSKIEVDGTLSSWRYETSLPVNMRLNGMVVQNRKLYVIQGYSGKAVYSTPIKSDGTLGEWSIVNSGLPADTFPASCLGVNGSIYTFGGYFGANAARVNFTASVNDDGTIAPWNQEPNLLPGQSDYTGVYHWKGRFYVAGGGGNSNPSSVYQSGTPFYSLNGTYYSRVIDLGSVRKLDKVSWTQSATPNGSKVSVSIRVAEESTIPLGGFDSVSNGEELNGIYARYVQYKVEMSAGGSIGIPARDQTPILDEISISHSSDSTPPLLQSYLAASDSIDVGLENLQSEIIEISTGSFSANDTFRTSKSELTLNGLTPNTNYIIRGRKINKYGRMSNSVVLFSTDTKSAAPSNLIAEESTINALKFSWNANGNPLTTTYLARLYLGTKAELIEQKIINIPALSFESLSLGTHYTLYIYALNINGSLGDEVSLSAKTKGLVAANPIVKVTTGSYVLEWSQQPTGSGYRILDGENKFIADLPSDATFYSEVGFGENERITRRLEYYAQSFSTNIVNASFFTAISPPKHAEQVLTILEKKPTSIRIRVVPPPNPVGQAGVRVRIVPIGSLQSPNYRAFASKYGSQYAAGIIQVDFNNNQWEQTITGLTPGIQYSILTSYVNADGIESSATSLVVDLNLSFSSAEEEIKLESDKFFTNEGLVFLISSNQSGNGTMRVYDVDQNRVRTVPFNYDSGNSAVKWDGRDENGQLVFSGIYWVVIESSQFGKKTFYVGTVR